MMNASAVVTAPADTVRHAFLQQGYTGICCAEQEIFVLGWMDPHANSERATHMYKVPAQRLPDGQLQVNAKLASFSGLSTVPSQLQAKADTELRELLVQLSLTVGLEHNHTDDEPTTIEETWNSMAPDEAAMKQLGHDMKQIQTNSELKKQGLIPDPMQ